MADLNKYFKTQSDSGQSAPSKYFTGNVSEVTQEPKKKSVFGKIAGFAHDIAEPFVELGVRPIQAVHSAISTIRDPLKEPNLNYDIPLYGKVSAPTEYKDVLKDVGRAAEVISYGLGGGAIKAGVKQAAKQTTLGLAKQGAIQGSKIGALGSAGHQVAQTGELSMDTLKAGATGAVVGGAIGGAVPLVAKGIKSTYETGRDFVSTGVAEKAEKVKLLKGNVPDARIATKTLENGKVVTNKAAKEVVRQGVPEADVALVRGGSRTDRSKMLKMLDTRVAQKTNARLTDRATDVPGNTFVDKIVKPLQEQNKKAALKLDVVARRLAGKKVDSTSALKSFADDLDNAGVKVRSDGTLNFKNSDFEGIRGAQSAIQNVWSRARRIANTGDALQLHRAKRYVDEIVDYGKATEGLSGRAQKLLKGFRHNADAVLDTKFPAYNQANTVFAETIGELNKIAEAMGKNFKVGQSFTDAKAGVVLRRLFSNTQSRGQLFQILESAQAVAKKNGAKIGEDVVAQAKFAETLERFLGNEAGNSMQGIVEKVVGHAERGASAAGDLARGNIIGGAFKAAHHIADVTRGISEDNLIKALRVLLKQGSGFTK